MSERAPRTTITLTVTVEQLRVLRHFSNISGISLNKFYDDYTVGMVTMIKRMGLMQKKHLSKLDAVTLVGKMLTTEV